MATYPIWQDVTHSVEVVGEYIDYDVRIGADIIYRGRAYVLPNETTAVIPIAAIAASHVSGKLEFSSLPTDIQQENWRKTFAIHDSLLDIAIAEYTFYADWSYGEDGMIQDGELNYLSRPMQLYVDPRQYFIASAGNLTPSTFGEWGISINGIRSVRVSTRYMSTVFHRWATAATEGAPITISGAEAPTYTVRKTCAQYALYYLNAVGGWDYLLLMGNVERANNYERVNMRQYANNLTYEHGEVVVSEKVDATWKLYTDYLSDTQWALMHHLTGSPQVYLHDLERNAVIPVNVTDTQQVYNTYANKGKKMTFAEIHVKASQQRYRR